MEQQLYRVSGTLPQGFVGHITYTTVLPAGLSRLRIRSDFDKREPAQELEALSQACMEAVAKNLPPEALTPSQTQALCALPKGEINFSVFLEEAALGTAHRDATEKEIFLSPTQSSPGFLPCRPEGVLKIVLHVFHILNDDTTYRLTVKGAML